MKAAEQQVYELQNLNSPLSYQNEIMGARASPNFTQNAITFNRQPQIYPRYLSHNQDLQYQ